MLLDQPAEDRMLSCVCVDNHAAAYDATLRLIALGHRRIAFVRPVVSSLKMIEPDSKERHAGFIAACREARLRDSDIHSFSIYDTETAVMGRIFKKSLHLPRGIARRGRGVFAHAALVIKALFRPRAVAYDKRPELPVQGGILLELASC